MVLRREEQIAQATANYRSATATYTLQKALDDLIERGCIDCAPDTVQFYRIKSGHLIRLLGSKTNLLRLSADRVREYIQTRRDEGAKDNTIIKELIALRRALKLAHERGLFPAEAMDIVPRFRVRFEPKDRWLTADQVQKLLRELRPHRKLWVLVAALAAGGGDEEPAMISRIPSGCRRLPSRPLFPSQKLNASHLVK